MSTVRKATKKGAVTIPERLLCEYCKNAKYLDQEDFTFCEICGAPEIGRAHV